MRSKSLIGIFFVAACVAALPFVTAAKPSKHHANGVLVCECCGQPDCACCQQKKRDKTPRIAECGFSRPMRVATMVNNRPFGWAEWIKTSGGQSVLESKGYGIDMFEEIAKKLQLRYQIVGYAQDQDAINDLKKGNLDLLVGIYTPSSTVGKNTVPVYPAMFLNVFTVYYLKDKAFDLNGDESLYNKKGVMRRTENIYPLFSARITPAMSISLETTESSFQKLLSGEADYLIGSPYSIEAELRRYKLQDKIVASPKSLMEASMFMILTRATDCFKLKSVLGAEIENYNSDPSRVNQGVRKVIDAWGERFRNVPGLTPAPEPEKEQGDEKDKDDSSEQKSEDETLKDSSEN